MTALAVHTNHGDPILPVSPPATARSPTPPPRPVADRAATPLGLVVDGDGSGLSRRESTEAPRRVGGAGMARTGQRAANPFSVHVPLSPAETPDLLFVSPAPVHADGDGVAGIVDSVPCAVQEQQQRRPDPSIATILKNSSPASSGCGCGSVPVPVPVSGVCAVAGSALASQSSSAASSLASSLHSPSAPTTRPHPIQAQASAPDDPGDPASQITTSTPPPDHDAKRGSPVQLVDARPLRTASVRADTRILHPKPIARSSPMSHGIPDNGIRSGSAAGNIAQLEATAERLSMTSSIDGAIRDLLGELKRSDSRRSAKLALAAMASVDEKTPSLAPQLVRHLSTTSSIVSTNIAARHGGYSPAGFVLSPNTSLTSRLRSGSGNSSARPDAAHDAILSRHGPGKSSVRSVRSTRMSLAEISESEPISLNQKAFDEADAAPPLEEKSAESLRLRDETVADMLSTDVLHQLLEDNLELQPDPQHAHVRSQPPAPSGPADDRHKHRPQSAHSTDTCEQARDAFIDFDGVHWEPQNEEDLYVRPDMEPGLPTPRPAPISMARPTSYIDPSTGQQMLYYPARVPAMLNLPPKLSSKPKTATRNQRRSQVLSMMMDAPQEISTHPQRKRQSTFDDLKAISSAAQEAPARGSWLPDPVANHRDSFAALSSFDPFGGGEAKSLHAEQDSLPTPPPEQAADDDAAPDFLRRPERLSKVLKEDRKSKASMLDTLPPQLRASAFFDLPSVAHEVEIKDGSAMATLDSILDASASAPVSAFTDHVYAGKLGSEVYGKRKKNKARQSVATIHGLDPEPLPKKRSSMMWLGKRNSSHDSDEQKRPHSSIALTRPEADGFQDGRHTPGSVVSADEAIRAHGSKAEDEDEDDGGEEEWPEAGGSEDAYLGPPTTLLAELQLRKQEQKQRVRNMGKGLPNGMYATLLDMDTVAEAQRKNRKNKRVNLAWEDPGAHLDQNGSDDEDVPLAILAAMQRGAKNLADLDRPMGLMERREQEDNEPLSHRRARLQGLGPPPPVLNQRRSVMSLSAAQALGVPPSSSQLAVTPSPEPEIEELEEETLGERRRRLAAKDGELPMARPVSCAFSAELLSQFGDAKDTANESKKKQGGRKEAQAAAASGEEETLGQRRRRLQAERDARQREISHGNSVGDQPVQGPRRRLSLADVLAAHPKRESERRTREQSLLVEEQRRAAQDQDAKMAALRMQMPSSLPQSGLERSGGFLGGVFNDGTGGSGHRAGLSSTAVNTQGLLAAKRSSMMTSYGPGYGPPTVGQAGYGVMNSYGQHYGGMNTMGSFNGRPATQMYGAGMMPVATNNGSMARVEQWRYGVRP
ncbi:uncharacterized protein MAM_04113 [Metarhizium album ARSEF 1941]|uniref:Uncharacterized protein n=1 Tax=Metarhizium album (strain ARSEF 1941) TaxID=1081103 RepID=A0A0B2WVT4_METAS|nr:uncharacterized protein MAM_04113 [Metarhizium album ARSEF 1941]KHN97724.1 hypothetical protein MAM_04113 [Metarhizium album ARSEF 1941]